MFAAVRTREADVHAVVAHESQIRERHESRSPAHNTLRGLLARGIGGSATVVVERYAPGESVPDQARGVLGSHSPEMDPAGQYENVRRESMSSLMRGEPQRVGLEIGGEHAEDGASAQRAARVARAVTAHEHELRVDDLAARVEIEIGEAVSRLELEPPYLRFVL